MSRSDSSSTDLDYWRRRVEELTAEESRLRRERQAAEIHLRKLIERRDSILRHSGGDFDD